MKIVILDALPLDADRTLDWSELEAIGKVARYDATDENTVSERIADADAVFTNKVRLSASQIAAAPLLRFIGVLATGYDVVDVGAATAKGVTVCNVPGYSTPMTAQAAIALLLEMCHHIGYHAGEVREGQWTMRGIWSFWDRPLTELNSKTMVVVGMGNVGRRVAQTAAALGMRVIAATVPGRESSEKNEDAALYPRVPLDEALSKADVVTLHCPLVPETRGLIHARRLSLLKPSALLVNTARGALVDEAAVAHALEMGKLAGYAADVLSTEPPAPDNPLLAAPRVYLTPHLAWASPEARQRLLAVSVDNLRAFLSGDPRHVVK